MQKHLILTVSLALSMALMGQERISPLTYDLGKKRDSEERIPRMQQRLSQQVDLPFIDDFSQDHFPGNAEGNTVLWEDMNASIHTSFGISPPSVGVAVFDGLDAMGQPYDLGVNSNGHADVLTSASMDLAGKVNVVLSFFFQPEGYGEAPEASDSLVLQFYDPGLDLWTNRWHATGSAAFPFAPIFLSVQEQYLQDGFQFRFRNYGRLTGALDQWAIDWVYLDENRSVDDEAITDVGFAEQVNSFLSSNYVSIPWDHYPMPSASENTIIQRDVVLRNNRNQGALISESGYTVDFDGTEIASFTDSQSPSIPSESNEAITQEVNSAPNSFVYPTTVSDTTAEFEVEFYFETSPDLHADNNRLSFTQVFSNYYAYDDGQADNAYGIQNFNGSGRVAFKFDIIAADTVKAVDMFFLYQGGAALEDQLFFLTIWEETNDAPGEIFYQDLTARQVEFDMEGGFVRYALQDTVILEANTSYFFGWVQPDEISLNIGNDLSQGLNDGRLYFDIGSNWQPSSYEGTIMLRPVFPPVDEILVGVLEEMLLEQLSIWPNPAAYEIEVQGDLPLGSIARLMDLEGRTVSSERLYPSQNRINVSHTSEGMYLLEISTPAGTRSVKKIVISR